MVEYRAREGKGRKGERKGGREEGREGRWVVSLDWIIWEFYFVFLKTLHAVFLYSCNNSHGVQQCLRPIFFLPFQNLLPLFSHSNHSNSSEIIPHYNFDLHYSDDYGIWRLFSCVCWPLLWILLRYACLPTSSFHHVAHHFFYVPHILDIIPGHAICKHVLLV